MKQINILITGATGFIGSHLLGKLEQTNHKIAIAVRNISIDNNLSGKNCIEINEIDSNTNWEIALKNIDIVIHLAARAHILKESALNPEAEFEKVNTQGTINLVQQSIQAGVKQFIFMSSIGAITSLSETILTETSPCHPDTPYGRSKLKAELAIQDICQNSAMNWTILRPTLVYGENNPGNMERLLTLTSKKIPLPLSSISNRRSLLYVGNLVDAIITCLEHPNAKNQTFIISDGEDLSTPELIRHLGKSMNKSPLLLPFPPSLILFCTKLIGKAQAGDRLLSSLQVDSSKIRQSLNWTPPYSIHEGLKYTAHWFKNRISEKS